MITSFVQASVVKFTHSNWYKAQWMATNTKWMFIYDTSNFEFQVWGFTTHKCQSFEGPGETDEESYKVMCVVSALLDESVVPHLWHVGFSGGSLWYLICLM